MWHPARHDPDYGHLLATLRSAQGQPLKPYQLAKEVLYREPPLPGDEFSHIRRLGNKLKDLVYRVDLALSKNRCAITGEEKRRVALKYIEYLMEPREKFGLTRAERETLLNMAWAQPFGFTDRDRTDGFD